MLFLVPAGLVLLGLIIDATPLEAGVVVLSNETDKTIECRVGPLWGQTASYRLAPGGLVAVRVPDSVEVTFPSDSGEDHRQVEPNTVHQFIRTAGGLVLRPVIFSEAAGGAWLHAALTDGPPPMTVVGVKILVDDDQPAVRAVWEKKIRKQLEAASRFFESHCAIRFEVTAGETWESDARHVDFRLLEEDFRQKVSPQPARLALGMTSQFRITQATRRWHPEATPLFDHLLLPDVHEGFSSVQQLEFLMHQLGHFLGGVHVADGKSVMRPSLGDANTFLAGTAPPVDPVNILLMNLVADEIRVRGVRSLIDVPRGTRRFLGAIYADMASRFPQDRQARRYADLVREPVRSRHRYTGRWIDGTQRTADRVTDWHQTGAAPKLAGRALFDSRLPIRWLRDNTLAPPDEPQAVIEFFGGDRLPGRVETHRSGSESPTGPSESYLVVSPHVSLDWPEGPQRPRIRVAAGTVRRIVWHRVTDRYQPQTLFLRDGRALRFRSMRLAGTDVRLLREDGIRLVPIAETAELHLGRLDPWEVYFGQLAALSPRGTARLVHVQTAGGLVATCSAERFGARSHGRQNDPAGWYHLVQPAWSLDPFWVRHETIRIRRYFAPWEVALSRIDPISIRQESDLGGSWPLEFNRNVQRGPLRAGGRSFPFGLGVHAMSELVFPLPSCSTSFSTLFGLDQMAGDGGCVRASVFLESAPGAPLFSSGLVIGSADVLDTGRLDLDAEYPQPRRLVLRVDPAHESRPSGTDPFDVRDIFNWLEPTVYLDPDKLRAEIGRKLSLLPGEIVQEQ